MRLWETDLRFAPGLPPGWSAPRRHPGCTMQTTQDARSRPVPTGPRSTALERPRWNGAPFHADLVRRVGAVPERQYSKRNSSRTCLVPTSGLTGTNLGRDLVGLDDTVRGAMHEECGALYARVSGTNLWTCLVQISGLTGTNLGRAARRDLVGRGGAVGGAVHDERPFPKRNGSRTCLVHTVRIQDATWSDGMTRSVAPWTMSVGHCTRAIISSDGNMLASSAVSHDVSTPACLLTCP